MGIKKWSDFGNNKPSTTNEKMKTFSKNVKKEDEILEKPQRSHVSASSEYADEVNQNIIKQGNRKSSKSTERKYKTGRTEQTIKDKSIYPQDTKDRGVANMGEEEKDIKENVEIYGKIAKFPEGVKASKAFNWVYNLKDPKLPKKDIWYLMVEKQDNELQMIKYQQKEGVNLTKFVYDLKEYYKECYKSNTKLVESINKIKLGGDKEGNISAITNIPNIKVEEGKKLITKITEDLVRLLS